MRAGRPGRGDARQPQPPAVGRDAASCAPIAWSGRCRRTLSSAREYREQLQKFLEGSADAITHVQEGIIVDANRAWLELFGYSGDDALTGTPLMDLFEQETHPALKGALVACLQGKWTDHGLKVQALLSDGSSAAARADARRKADYENEPATRISIPARNKKDHDLELQLARGGQERRHDAASCSSAIWSPPCASAARKA